MPSTLGEAIATEPVWLQGWVAVLVAVHLPAIAFAVGREAGRWRLRSEPIAILVDFAVAGVAMDWLYGQVGYVRFLGLAHLIGWTPAFVWVLSRRRTIESGSLFSKWVSILSDHRWDVAGDRLRRCDSVPAWRWPASASLGLSSCPIVVHRACPLAV